MLTTPFRQRLQWICASISIVASSVCLAQSAASRIASFGIAPAQVKATDDTGRWTRLVDDKNREFTLSYDSKGRLTSLTGATRKTGHDMRSVSYLSDGSISDVLFGSGYTLHFEYPDANTQLIVDSMGNYVKRVVDGNRRMSVQSASDQNGLLVGSLNKLDVLFARVRTTSSTGLPKN